MEAGAIRPGYELWRPNREKPEAKSARALVVFLLLVTAALMFVIIIGGWTRLEGVKPLTILYAALYVLFAFLVLRWQRAIELVPRGKPVGRRRYDVPQHLAPETSDALRLRAVEGDLELLDRCHRPSLDRSWARRLQLGIPP